MLGFFRFQLTFSVILYQRTAQWLEITQCTKWSPQKVQKPLDITHRYYNISFLRLYFFIFKEKGKEGEGEKHQCVVASLVPPSGNLACDPGMCPEWEAHHPPFGSQASSESTEPGQPGPLQYY